MESPLFHLTGVIDRGGIRPPAMKTILMASLRDAAKSRPGGYMEDCLARGKVEGEFLVLAEADYVALRLKYSPRGLGDQAARVLKPLARLLDGVLGTDLEHCPACAERQAWLNGNFPVK
jgi:hypothetical protein